MNLIEYKKTLGSLISNGELALPDNVPAEAFRNAAVVAYTDNPKLASCTPQSLFQSIRRLAYMGLVPDGQEAAIVPFKAKEGNQWVEKAQAMPMVAGLIKRARNSGEITDIRAHIVYQNEVDQGRFVYQIGDEEKLVHDPILFGEKGPPVGCYAIAVLKDGSIIREFMGADEVDKVRRAGASQKIYKQGQKPEISDTAIGIWADWQGEMWKKTVIRRLCKRLPISSEDRRRLIEEPDEFPEMQDITPQRESLEDRLAREAEPEAVEGTVVAGGVEDGDEQVD